MKRRMMAVWIFALALAATPAGAARAQTNAPLNAADDSRSAVTSSTVTQAAAGAWIEDYRAGLALARKYQRPVLIDFRADWCGPCKMMERTTFTDANVAVYLKQFVCVRVDVDKDHATAMAWRISGIPRLIMLNVHNQVIGDLTGFMPAEDFAARLEDALKISRERQTEAREAPAVAADAREKKLKSQLAAASEDTLTSAVAEVLTLQEPKERQQGLDQLKLQAARLKPVLLRLLGNERLAVRVGAQELLEALGDKEKEPQALKDAKYDPWAASGERREAWGKVVKTTK
jgi:thiol-disulfide isomerase/thioredoxin